MTKYELGLVKVGDYCRISKGNNAGKVMRICAIVGEYVSVEQPVKPGSKEFIPVTYTYRSVARV